MRKKRRKTTIPSENPAADDSDDSEDSDDSDDQDTGGCNFEDPADVYFRSEANGDLNSYGSDGAPSPDNSQKSEAYDQNTLFSNFIARLLVRSIIQHWIGNYIVGLASNLYSNRM